MDSIWREFLHPSSSTICSSSETAFKAWPSSSQWLRGRASMLARVTTQSLQAFQFCIDLTSPYDYLHHMNVGLVHKLHKFLNLLSLAAHNSSSFPCSVIILEINVLYFPHFCPKQVFLFTSSLKSLILMLRNWPFHMRPSSTSVLCTQSFPETTALGRTPHWLLFLSCSSLFLCGKVTPSKMYLLVFAVPLFSYIHFFPLCIHLSLLFAINTLVILCFLNL